MQVVIRVIPGAYAIVWPDAYEYTCSHKCERSSEDPLTSFSNAFGRALRQADYMDPSGERTLRIYTTPAFAKHCTGSRTHRSLEIIQKPSPWDDDADGIVRDALRGVLF